MAETKFHINVILIEANVLNICYTFPFCCSKPILCGCQHLCRKHANYKSPTNSQFWLLFPVVIYPTQGCQRLSYASRIGHQQILQVFAFKGRRCWHLPATYPLLAVAQELSTPWCARIDPALIDAE